MGWLTPLYGKTVALDTAPLIYFMEKHPVFLPRVRPFFLAMAQGDFKVVTSALTLTEALVHPIRHNNRKLATTYRDILLNTDHLKTIPATDDVAETAARLRARHDLRTPDAIQVATTIVAQADFFLTNDSRLSTVPYPTVLVLGTVES